MAWWPQYYWTLNELTSMLDNSTSHCSYNLKKKSNKLQYKPWWDTHSATDVHLLMKLYLQPQNELCFTYWVAWGSNIGLIAESKNMVIYYYLYSVQRIREGCVTDNVIYTWRQNRPPSHRPFSSYICLYLSLITRRKKCIFRLIYKVSMQTYWYGNHFVRDE